MTEMEKAYAAGVIDSDGCITLSRGKNPLAGGGFTWNFVALVKVGVTDRKMVEWLEARWGGRITDDGARRSGHKPMFNWQLWGANAEAMLKDIKPHLITKDEQAMFLLAHRALVGRHGKAVSFRANASGQKAGGSVSRPECLTEVHQKIFEKLRELKQLS